MRDIKKVVIIQAGRNMCVGLAKKFPYTNITCPTIAAAMPDNVEIEIIDMYIEEINYESINADLAFVTTLTTFAPTAFEVAKELKKKGITTIVGGVHAVVKPEECQQHFDAIAIGEAELLIDDIFNDFRNGILKKRYETSEQMDLTKCKIPRYDLLKLHNYSFATIIASKGCAFDCDFCSSRLVTGTGFRHKTVDQVISEIKYLQKLQEKNPLAADTFYFVDSNLYTDRGFLKELLTALIPLNIYHWGLFASVNIANDDEILELLQKAHCEVIQIGFESINPVSLTNINKKHNNPVKYKEAVEKLAAKGIYANGTFIFGFDDDNCNVFKDTAEVIEEANIVMTGLFTLTPYPGTKIYERFSGEGRILNSDWSKYNMHGVNFQPKMMSVEELKNGIKYVQKRLYDPERLVKGLEKFNEASGKNPRLKASEKIALIIAYGLMFFKYKPETKYFIKKLISKGNLIDYNYAVHLISTIQNSE